MASEMVERLAKLKAKDAAYVGEYPHTLVRWWLNAIADELERGIPMEHWSGWEAAVAWLRAQAGETPDNG